MLLAKNYSDENLLKLCRKKTFGLFFRTHCRSPLCVYTPVTNFWNGAVFFLVHSVSGLYFEWNCSLDRSTGLHAVFFAHYQLIREAFISLEATYDDGRLLPMPQWLWLR